jgi:uncharacterized membrane protein YkoI
VNPNKRKWVMAGALAAVLVGGGASVAAASGTSPAPASAAADSQQADGETNDGPDGGAGSAAESQDRAFTGSVVAPDGNQPDGEATGDESQEAAVLAPLAKVTSSEAEQAALAAVPGTVQQTQLGNENGFVVYSVGIKAADGTITDVKVDAGDAKILAQDSGQDAETADGADQPEGANDPQD